MPRADQLAAFAAQWGLELIVLFGSHVKGYATPRSDTDVAVLRSRREPVAPNQFFRLAAAIEEMLGVVNVDLVDLARVPPLLQMHVARDGIALYEAHPWVFARFKVLAFKLHHDAAYDLYRHRRRSIDRGLEILAETKRQRDAVSGGDGRSQV